MACVITKANPPFKSILAGLKKKREKGRDCLLVLVLFIRLFGVRTVLVFGPFKLVVKPSGEIP